MTRKFLNPTQFNNSSVLLTSLSFVPAVSGLYSYSLFRKSVSPDSSRGSSVSKVELLNKAITISFAEWTIWWPRFNIIFYSDGLTDLRMFRIYCCLNTEMSAVTTVINSRKPKKPCQSVSSLLLIEIFWLKISRAGHLQIKLLLWPRSAQIFQS